MANALHRCLSVPFIGRMLGCARHIGGHCFSTLASPSSVLAGAQVVFQVLSQFLLKALSIASARCMHNQMLRQLLRCAPGVNTLPQALNRAHRSRPAAAGRAMAPCRRPPITLSGTRDIVGAQAWALVGAIVVLACHALDPVSTFRRRGNCHVRAEAHVAAGRRWRSSTPRRWGASSTA